MSTVNSFGTRTPLTVGSRTYQMFSLPALQGAGFPQIARLPFSLKILLENLLRHEDGRFVKAADVEALARWDVKGAVQKALAVATTLRTLPFDVNLWQAQNIWNDLFRRSDKDYWSPEWKLLFKNLGEALYISVDELVTEEGVPAF